MHGYMVVKFALTVEKTQPSEETRISNTPDISHLVGFGYSTGSLLCYYLLILVTIKIFSTAEVA